jgi:hypothetical protein
LTPELDRPHACIYEHFDPGWLCRHKSEVVGCRRPVDHEPCLITTRDGLDHRVVAQGSLCAYQPLVAEQVVKSPIDAPQFSGGNEPLECLIDRCTTTKISEITRGPNPTVVGFDSLHYASAEVG